MENIKDKSIDTAKKAGIKREEIKVVKKKTFIHNEIIFGIALGVISTALLVLIVLAKLQPYYPIDLKVTLFLQKFTNPIVYYFMWAVSIIGNGFPKYIFIFLASYFLYFRKLVKESVMLLFSALGAGAIALFLKHFVSRNRPDPNLIHQVYHFDNPDSFPSGHVSIYVGFFGFLLFLVYTLVPPSRLRSFLLVLLIGLVFFVGPSRIYLGSHWFTDVLGAYLASFLWVVFSIFIYNKWRFKNEK